MTVFKSSNVSVEIKNGKVDIGDVGVKFYTQDINTTLLNIRVLKDEQFLNFNDEQYKPFINLFMGDGSVFLDQPVEISDAENGLLTYKLADKVKHAGWVKFKLILKKEDESLHAANFKLEILDSGLESEIGRVIDVDILMNAFERFALNYPEKIRGKAFTYDDFTEEQLASLKGEKGDIGPKGDPGADGKDGVNGKSAYELALANGFKGSEAEWIASLKGKDGISVVPDGSITTVKVADKAITNAKLSTSFASVKRIYNSDNLNTLTSEGVYYKFAGAAPSGLPTELVGEDLFLDVRAWYATSTSNYVIQSITVNNSLNKRYVRIVKGGEVPKEFTLLDAYDKGHIVKKETLNSSDLNNVVLDGYYLGLSTNQYQNMPKEMEGRSFLLRIESFAQHQGFVVQSIYQTSGRIDVAFKRFVQVKSNEPNVVGEWFKDKSLGKNDSDSSSLKYPAIAGKNIVHFGDSLTEFGTYHEIITAISGATTTSIGFGGCRMANVPADHFRYKYNEMSMVSVSESIKNKDFTALEQSAQSLKTNDNDDNTPQVQRLKAIDFSKVDYITIMYGTNDFTSLVPLGNQTSTNPEEFNGAINKTVENILSTYPHIKVLFLTPTWRARQDIGDGKESDTVANKNGNYLIEYVDAIKTRAAAHKLPSYDLYRNSGINKFTTNHYQTDGLHLTPKGDEVIARAMSSQLSEF